MNNPHEEQDRLMDEMPDTAPQADPGSDPVEVHGGATGVPLEPAPAAVRRLEEQLEETRDRHMRLAAEFDNFRKRVARERLELADRAQAQLSTRLLDVLDDLDRLMAAPTEGLTPEGVREAVGLVERKLWKELREAGLERLDPVGAPFDPSVHEAIATAPAPEPGVVDTVAATFQAGYLFRGTLVRPARVQVYTDGDGA